MNGRQGTEQAFLVPTRDLVREGQAGWHEQGLECQGYLENVHPRSRPVIIFAAPGPEKPTHDGPCGHGVPCEPRHPVPRWEVRVSHYRDDGSVASHVATLSDFELAARRLPIGPWSAIRALAGALVSQIQNAERAAGRG